MASSEILQIADAVAREEHIPKEAVLQAMEEAIRVAARRKYGHEHSIRARIDRHSGEIQLCREMVVVQDLEDEVPEELLLEHPNISKISLAAAKLKNTDSEIGDILSEQLPSIDLGRGAAQSAKQVIALKVKEIKRQKQIEEFKGRVGEILHGTVDRVEYGNVFVKIGSAEIPIFREHLLFNDKFQQGDRVRALLLGLDDQSPDNAQIVLSRTDKGFLMKLFEQEVPEVYDDIIEIKAVARIPGVRAKVAVYSSDPAIDAVGSCVGVRGSRVQAITNELQGEKIDLIPWSRDSVSLVVHALAPAQASKVIIDEEQNKIEVVIPDDQLSIAIGKRGQNVKLASELVGWELDILSEAAEAKRRSEEFSNSTALLIKALDVEEILAQLLVAEGFNNVHNIATTKINDLANIDGLDEGIAEELITRAQSYVRLQKQQEPSPDVVVQEDVVEEAAPVQGSPTVAVLLEIPGMTEDLALKLITSNITSVIEVADLSRDEFLEIIADAAMKPAVVDCIIMAARKISY